MTRVLADRYELGETLGSGGMARVVAAHDRRLQRPVAVKMLREEIAGSGQDRFLREARTAASLTHPHAVAVYDTGRDGDTPFIVMELVDGPTLAELLAQRGPLGPEEAGAVLSQVLAALAAAHRRGLVHRDVKPGNILLPGAHVPRHPNEEPGVKLADFGIAKGLGEAGTGLTVTGQVLGTPRYVSPEQVAGQPATPRSDVYSAGIVLYELLAGEPPFSGDSPIAVALAHREDPVPRLDRKRRGLDAALVATVHRALEKDPERRFADAAEMRQALADPTSVPPLPAPSATTARIATHSAPTEALGAAAVTTVLEEAPDAEAEGEAHRRARWPWGVLAAVIVVAGIAAAVWFAGGLDEDPALEPAEPTEPVDEPDAPPPEEDPPEPDPDETDPEETDPGETDPGEADPGDADEAPAEDDPPPGNTGGADDGEADRSGDEADGDGAPNEADERGANEQADDGSTRDPSGGRTEDADTHERETDDETGGRAAAHAAP